MKKVAIVGSREFNEREFIEDFIRSLGQVEIVSGGARGVDTIAEEVGAKTLMLNPLEGTTDPNATYISLMRENLNNLKIALECD